MFLNGGGSELIISQPSVGRNGFMLSPTFASGSRLGVIKTMGATPKRFSHQAKAGLEAGKQSGGTCGDEILCPSSLLGQGPARAAVIEDPSSAFFGHRFFAKGWVICAHDPQPGPAAIVSAFFSGDLRLPSSAFARVRSPSTRVRSRSPAFARLRIFLEIFS